MKRPIRVVLRAILRFNGLVRFANETEEQFSRRRRGEADFFSRDAPGDIGGGGDFARGGSSRDGALASSCMVVRRRKLARS